MGWLDGISGDNRTPVVLGSRSVWGGVLAPRGGVLAPRAGVLAPRGGDMNSPTHTHTHTREVETWRKGGWNEGWVDCMGCSCM